MQVSNPIVHKVSAPCSSGKTYSTCKYIAAQRKRCNWLYVAPSIKLLNQTKTDLEKTGLKPTVITSETHDPVIGAIMRYMNHAEESGEILLITWQSYQRLPFFENRQNWRVIIDEVPQVDDFYPVNLRQHIDELNEYVQLGAVVNETLAVVEPVDPDKLKRLLDRPDDLTKTIQPFLSDVLSPYRDVFVDLKTWDSFADRQVFGKNGTCNRIYFLSMLNPVLFEGNTLLGANIEDSLLYNWLSGYHSVEFKTNHRIQKNLRFTKHPPKTGNRLRINYLLRDRGYSKYLSGKSLGDDGQTWMDALDKAALKYIDGRNFLFAVNNDYKGRLLDHSKYPNATRMPVISHGLNEYMEHNLIYFPVALNRQPRHLQMLNHLGLDDQMIKDSTIHEVIYQALMRTSLRDPESYQVVDCIVPEYAAAARLASAFGTVSMKWIGDDDFDKKTAMTGSERNRKSNHKKRLDRLLPDFSDDYSIEVKELRHEKVADRNVRHAPLYAVTFHATIFDTEGEHFVLDLFEPNEFVREMRSLSKYVVEDKTSNYMINSAVFEKRNDSEEGLRRQVNFLQSSMMILDFDNGQLTPERFLDIFWEKAGRGGKRSFLMFNSFSCSPEQPNRFRVIMLYKSPATSLEAHQAVYDSVVNRLELHGYTEETSGLDNMCRTGVQSFYVPCTNAAYPDHQFFIPRGCDTRGIERYGIEPDAYLRTAMKPKPQAKIVGIRDHLESDVTKSIQDWKDEINGMICGRRKTVFGFAFSMAAHHRLSRSEVEDHLYSLDRDANLDAHIEGALASLEDKGYSRSVA